MTRYKMIHVWIALLMQLALVEMNNAEVSKIAIGALSPKCKASNNESLTTCIFNEYDKVELINSESIRVKVENAGKLDILEKSKDANPKHVIVENTKNTIIRRKDHNSYASLDSLTLIKTSSNEINYKFNDLQVLEGSNVYNLKSKIRNFYANNSQISNLESIIDASIIEDSRIDTLSSSLSINIILNSSINYIKTTSISGSNSDIKDTTVDYIRENGLTVEKNAKVTLNKVNIKKVYFNGIIVYGELILQNVTIENIHPSGILIHKDSIVRVKNLKANNIDENISARITGNTDITYPFKIVFATYHEDVIIHSVIAGVLGCLIVCVGVPVIWRKQFFKNT